ncbi:MAG: CvpA family protein [Lachnospiraceae bacterium]|nr:CvpA family protein [Lachnospiraceae bacterium]
MNEVWAAVALILLVFAFKGHCKGITGEIASLLSLALSILGIAVIVRAVGSYMEHNTNGIVQAGVFFVALAFLSQILRLVFSSMKILTHIPVIHGIDSFVGMIVGIAEGVLVVWALFIVIAKYDIAGRSAQWLMIIENDVYLSKLSALNPFARFFGV